MTGDPRRIAIDEILRLYQPLVEEWNQAQEQINKFQIRQNELVQQSQDFIAAARVLGFDLNEEYQHYRAEQLNNYINNVVSTMGTIITAQKPRSVKAMVLSIAEAAYPNPVRASEIRSQLTANGIVVHDKTIGMTLYRWLKHGCLRRENWDWYFIPPDLREGSDDGTDDDNNDNDLDEENPGDDPGLFSAAE